MNNQFIELLLPLFLFFIELKVQKVMIFFNDLIIIVSIYILTKNLFQKFTNSSIPNIQHE